MYLGPTVQYKECGEAHFYKVAELLEVNRCKAEARSIVIT